MSRDKLRSATVGGKKTLKKEIVTVNGEKFEVRQITVGDRKKLVERATSIVDGNPRINFVEWNLWQVILATFVPGTEERVFEDADYDELISHPAGGFIDELSTALDRLNSVNQEEVAKNSAQTQSG